MRLLGVVVAAAVSWYAAPAMGQNTSPSLICAVYGDEDGALNALEELRHRVDRDEVDSIRSYAVVSRDWFGNVHVVRSDQRLGTIAAAVVEALTGRPPAGMPYEDFEILRESLRPGRSALVAALEEQWAVDLARSLYHTGDPRRVLRSKLDECLAKLP